MHKLQAIFANYYTEDLFHSLPVFHQKVANDILRCQSGAFGSTEISCGICGNQKTAMNGCGNRYCSGCQKSKGAEWAEKQKQKLLPGVNYFMVTFTIPEEARNCFHNNQQECYDALFRCASQTIIEMLSDKENLGVKNLGFFGVLHSGGRILNYHPHIHFVVPNGGLSDDLSEWQNGRADKIFDVKAACEVFREKIMAELSVFKSKYPDLNTVQDNGWHVRADAMGSGENLLEYLSRYLFKSVIAESNILSWHDGKVCFQYRKKKSNQLVKMTLTADEFLRRFFYLVLPKGFRKVRHYGFLSAKPLKTIPEMIEIISFGMIVQAEAKPKKKSESSMVRCEICSSTKVTMVYTKPSQQKLVQKE
jgi:hypothetical protein